jgi:hypothetical protein
MGAEADIIAYLTSRYFGLRAFGRGTVITVNFLTIRLSAAPIAGSPITTRLSRMSASVSGRLSCDRISSRANGSPVLARVRYIFAETLAVR